MPVENLRQVTADLCFLWGSPWCSNVIVLVINVSIVTFLPTKLVVLDKKCRDVGEMELHFLRDIVR